MRRALVCLLPVLGALATGCTGGMAGHEKTPDGARQVAEGFFDAVAGVDAGMACELLTVAARTAAEADGECHDVLRDAFDEMGDDARRAVGDLGVEAVQVRGDRAVVEAGGRTYDLAFEQGRWRVDPQQQLTAASYVETAGS